MNPTWADLCVAFGLRKDGKIIWDLLESLYSTPGRYYHTMDHINEMVHACKEYDFINYAEDYCALEFAIFFHDVIYNSARKDNEALSAELFAYLFNHTLANDAISSSTFQTYLAVHKLIMVTVDHKPTPGTDEELIVDLDLMRLADPWETFIVNNNNIRLEYSWVSDEDFAVGRPAVFNKFLGMETIFHTAMFQDMFEVTARHNLERALEHYKE